MANFQATFYHVQNRDLRGTSQPVPAGRGAIGTETLSTSASAQPVQRGGSAWSAPGDGYVRVRCDGAVRVAVGETAATGASPVGHYVAAEESVDLSIREGQGLSVINA